MHFFIRFALLTSLTFSIAAYAQDQQKHKPTGVTKYGNVVFADSLHHKYPIDTDKHIRAAWAFIHTKQNASKYSPEELKAIKQRILAAATSHKIKFKTTD